LLGLLGSLIPRFLINLRVHRLVQAIVEAFSDFWILPVLAGHAKTLIVHSTVLRCIEIYLLRAAGIVPSTHIRIGWLRRTQVLLHAFEWRLPITISFLSLRESEIPLTEIVFRVMRLTQVLLHAFEWRLPITISFLSLRKSEFPLPKVIFRVIRLTLVLLHGVTGSIRLPGRVSCSDFLHVLTKRKIEIVLIWLFCTLVAPRSLLIELRVVETPILLRTVDFSKGWLPDPRDWFVLISDILGRRNTERLLTS
jgi:hypothetical protein